MKILNKEQLIDLLIEETFIVKFGTEDRYIVTEKLESFETWYNTKGKVKTETEPTTKKPTSTDVVFNDEWIENWNNKFDFKKRFGITTLARSYKSGLSGVKERMLKFIAVHKNKYSLDIIDKATDMYIEEQRKQKIPFYYAKESSYFIEKRGEPSVLEKYCEIVYNNMSTYLTEDDEPDMSNVF